MAKIRPISLLMTATITPMPGIKTRIPDPAVRLADYQRGLEHNMAWLGRGLDHIVFMDNSASDLEPLVRLVQGDPRVTLHSFQGISYPPDYGYGYGEFALVQHAMDNFPILSSGLTAKVTGRYQVMNFDKLLPNIPDVDLYCDIRNVRAPWLDMRFMVWSSVGFETILRDAYLDLRDDLNRLPPEMKLSRTILASTDVPRRTFFPIEPVFNGARGFDGANWGTGREGLATSVRNLVRPVIYGLGLYPGAKGDRTSMQTLSKGT